MADKEAITIPLELPRDEAAALSQFVKRVDYDTCIASARLGRSLFGRLRPRTGLISRLPQFASEENQCRPGSESPNRLD
jgi:hypothetical protein